jgi:hypothetical protein
MAKAWLALCELTFSDKIKRKNRTAMLQRKAINPLTNIVKIEGEAAAFSQKKC